MIHNLENHDNVNKNSIGDPKILITDKITKLSSRNWLILAILGVAGQIAWAIENTWFNEFVFNEITKDSDAIAWMVGVSAFTATITTIIMGIISDRTISKWGRRKPFIFIGYIFWGIITAIFPMVEWIQVTGIAVIMVVILDAVMTFFGSMANDAALNAWATDISDVTNRGRIQGILAMTTLIANLIALGLAGIIIDLFGYFVFFYILGGFVSLSGLVCGLLMKEPNSHEEAREKRKIPFKHELFSIINPKTFLENKVLTILFINMAIWGIGSQIASPYLFQYIESYLGYNQIMLSVIGGVALLIGVIISLIYGYISHHFNRWWVIMIIITFNSGCTFLFAYLRNLLLIVVIEALILSTMMIYTIEHGAWMQDLYPTTDRGKFQGIRMIFFVAIPMIFGPPIGSRVIKTYGIECYELGELIGHNPSPSIFIFSALVSLLALIPMFFIQRQDRKKGFQLKSKSES